MLPAPCVLVMELMAISRDALRSFAGAGGLEFFDMMKCLLKFCLRRYGAELRKHRAFSSKAYPFRLGFPDSPDLVTKKVKSGCALAKE